MKKEHKNTVEILMKTVSVLEEVKEIFLSEDTIMEEAVSDITSLIIELKDVIEYLNNDSTFNNFSDFNTTILKAIEILKILLNIVDILF